MSQPRSQRMVEVDGVNLYLTDTAVHEAGHAVVMHEMGVRFVRVELRRKGCAGGAVVVPRGGMVATRLQLTTGLVAGAIAERLYAGKWNWPGASDDFAQIHQVANRDGFHAAEMDRLVRMAAAAAGAVLDQHWSRCALVAAHLVRELELSHARVGELILDRGGSGRRALRRAGIRMRSGWSPRMVSAVARNVKKVA